MQNVVRLLLVFACLAMPVAFAQAPLTAEPPPAAAAPATDTAAPPADAAAPSDAATPPPDTRGLDQEVQGLKKDVVDLNRELFVLEEELLFPANTQVAVFVSMDVGDFFALDSVTLKIDQKEVINYLYTPREVDALLKGGVHRLYLGNLKVGRHELVAFFNGESYRLYMLMAIIGVTGWTGYARFLRAEFLTLRNQDFVHAAIAAGLPLRIYRAPEHW